MRWLSSVNGQVSETQSAQQGKHRAHDGQARCPRWASTVPNFNPNRSLDLVCILSLINRKIILPQSPESMLIVGELAQENRGKINI